MTTFINLSTEQTEDVTGIVSAMQDKPGALLPILHAIQDQLGYIPDAAVATIAGGLQLSRAEVHGVISFYHFFRSKPVGNHVVQICRAESCQAMGSRRLEAHAKSQLNIDYHQTTADGEITLEPVYCLGNCACSPSLRINQAVHSHVDEQQFDQLIAELLTQTLEVQ
ncbi:MAG: formate dehydrogenase subunit gamma [Oceanicoccus sp.]|jgi:formate dehydrogenase subunit gamma